VGPEIEGLSRFGRVALAADVGLSLVQPDHLVVQPLAELSRHGLQRLLGPGDGVGVDAAEAAADLGAQGIGRADDLVGHGRLLNNSGHFVAQRLKIR